MLNGDTKEEGRNCVAGDYDPRLHFACGLLFGGALGVWIAWQLCDGVTSFSIVLVLVALSFAWASARWGDAAWEWVMERFNWFT